MCFYLLNNMEWVLYVPIFPHPNYWDIRIISPKSVQNKQ